MAKDCCNEYEFKQESSIFSVSFFKVLNKKKTNLNRLLEQQGSLLFDIFPRDI